MKTAAIIIAVCALLLPLAFAPACEIEPPSEPRAFETSTICEVLADVCAEIGDPGCDEVLLKCAESKCKACTLAQDVDAALVQVCMDLGAYECEVG